MACEKSMKLLIYQKGKTPPNTHDLAELNNIAGKIVQDKMLNLLPSKNEANQHRYGELTPPSVSIAMEYYLLSLSLVYTYTKSLKRKFVLNNASFQFKLLPGIQENVPFTFENTPFRVRRFLSKARRKIAGIAIYFKVLQRRLWRKIACCK